MQTLRTGDSYAIFYGAPGLHRRSGAPGRHLASSRAAIFKKNLLHILGFCIRIHLKEKKKSFFTKKGLNITESDDPQGSFQNLQVQNSVFYLYVKGGEEDRESKRRKERIRRGGRGILGQGEQEEEKRIGQSDRQ